MQPKSYAPEAVLRGYFHAKDENRPHLLEEVFTSDAELVIHNQSENIAFPAVTHGRLAISEVLVRSFTLSYENIYSFYLDRPTVGFESSHAPGWLACLSELPVTFGSAAVPTFGRSSLTHRN